MLNVNWWLGGLALVILSLMEWQIIILDPIQNLHWVVLRILLAIIGCILCWLFFVPMERVRLLKDTGFSHLTYGKEEIDRSQKMRKVGNTPPPFPNGWYVLLESRELKVGQVKSVDALGKNFAVFRGESGETFVTGAYCPHLGANLGVGGYVAGDCITCPFHCWKFDGKSGAVAEIPYCSSRPKNAKLETFTCLERNQLIYTWHHEMGEEPLWEPPVLEEVDNKSWRYQGRTVNFISCHIQDVSENGADPAHLSAVHQASILTGGEPSAWLAEWFGKFTKHEWSAAWTPGKPKKSLDSSKKSRDSSEDSSFDQAEHAEKRRSPARKKNIPNGKQVDKPANGSARKVPSNGDISNGKQVDNLANGDEVPDDDEFAGTHTAFIRLSHKMLFFNKFNLISLEVKILQIGPSIVHLKFSSFLGEGVMIQYVLPVEPMVQKIVHVFYTQNSWIPPYAKLVLFGEAIQLERDIRIWNSKTYIRNPVLCKGDKLALQHRRWFNQFYSKKSIDW